MRAFPSNMQKLQPSQGVKSILKAYQQLWGRDHQVGVALNLTGSQTKEKRCGNNLHQPLSWSDSESRRTPRSTAFLLGVRKERIPVRPPSVDGDQPHSLSLCDPDRSCPDVRLRHNGGKETARLCPSRCGRVRLLPHQK